jgi:hypothetical protein
VKAFEAMAANPSSRLVVVPMESAALAGGITQAMELLRGTAPLPPPATPGGGGVPGGMTGGRPWNRA